MLMTDQEIKKAISSKTVVIEPFTEDRLQGASYDLALGKEALVSKKDELVMLSEKSNNPLVMKAGDFALVITKEFIKLPQDIAVNIGMKSRLARHGLMLLAGMQVDPGFEGHLRLGLYNASPVKIVLDYDADLCMLQFHKLSGPVEHVAPKIPALIEGHIPHDDRAFLRQLETTSLSEIDTKLRELVQSVAKMATLQKLIGGGILAIIISVIASIVKGLCS